MCPRFSTLVSVEPLSTDSTPSLLTSHPVSGCLCPCFPFPLASRSVQDDISTVAAMFLSTAPPFTNARLHAGRASPNKSLTEAGVVCPKFSRTPQSVHRGGPDDHDHGRSRRWFRTSDRTCLHGQLVFNHHSQTSADDYRVHDIGVDRTVMHHGDSLYAVRVHRLGTLYLRRSHPHASSCVRRRQSLCYP